MVKGLREEGNLTQVQLAQGLGITPTSVYRYESGRNTPRLELLLRMLDFAEQHNLLKSARELTQEVDYRMGMDNPEIKRLMRESFEKAGKYIVNIANRLWIELDQQQVLLVMAFCHVLRHEKDERIRKVAISLCEPWLELAKYEFEGNYKFDGNRWVLREPDPEQK